MPARLPRLSSYKGVVGGFIRLLTALLLFQCGAPRPAMAREVAVWTSDNPAAEEKWSANGDVKLEGVRYGALSGQVTGKGPILLGPAVAIPTSPYGWVEVRFRSSQAGPLTLFWALTTEEPYGGFRPSQLLAAPCIGDGAFHSYRFFPLLHPGQRLLRLRLDPPPGTHFALQSVRVVEDEPSAASPFRAPESGTTVDVSDSPTSLQQRTLVPTWEIRPVDSFPAKERPWLVLSPHLPSPAVGIGDGERGSPHPPTPSPKYRRGGVSTEANPDSKVTLPSGGGRFQFGWLSNDVDGLQEGSATLSPEAGTHLTNVPMVAVSTWKGMVTALAVLRQPGEDGSAAGVSAASEPAGPADPVIRRLLFWTVEPRAGKDAPDAVVVADVSNGGGKPASGLTALLTVPAELRLISPARQPVETLETGDVTRLRWTVHADRPVNGSLHLTLSSPVGDQTLSTVVEIPVMKGVKSTAVPLPHPLASAYDVGVYYFPGWQDYSRWKALDEFPERTPALGYYREGDPVVAEWHLKWMAEHGVRFIAYDWYWDRGSRSLEHAIDNGYLKARNRKFVKFCLLWANHNPPHSSSAADLEAVTSYWLTHFFRLPEYYTIDGRPVVIIFSPGRFTEDMGAPAVKAAFGRIREQCRAAGLPGIYFVACVNGSPGEMQEAADEGYDAASGYNYPGVNAPPGSLSAPYATMVPGYEAVWNRALETPALPYIAPTAPGWDNRPWAGDRALVRTGSTPALFGQMLRNARHFADVHPLVTKDGPRKVVLVEAWNEFGEGDYVEPCRGFGFGMLDAIRDAFGTGGQGANYVDLVPADVGMGPYELLPVPPATRWIFTKVEDALGWSPQNMKDFHLAADGLHATAATDDPAFIGPAMNARAAEYSRVEVKLSVDAGTDGQLFWATPSNPFSETQSIHFTTIPDGKLHTYTIQVSKNPTWTGHITQLRVDPSSVVGRGAVLGGVEVGR